jgi:hypothetical protein
LYSTTDAAAETAIPRQYWSVPPLPPDEGNEEILVIQGVVLIQAFGRRETGMDEEIRQKLPRAQLLAQASRYSALLEAERIVRQDLRADAECRRLWLEDSELKERIR